MARKTTPPQPEPEKGPILAAHNPDAMFDSMEDERQFHARKAEQFKSRLNTQVSELKTEAVEVTKKGALIGGALIGATILLRAVSGSKKKWVETPEGPVKIKSKEPLLWSLAKGAVLVGIGYLAKDRIIEFIDKNLTQSDENGDTQLPTDDPYTQF